MSEMNPFSTDQWVQVQHYQETTTGTPPSNLTRTTTVGSNTNLNNIRAQASAAKSIRRRSRALRRTPTTLVTASATNFRALVQQFTGYHGPTAGALSLGKRKGPLNINFERNDSSRYNTTCYNQQNPILQVGQPQELQSLQGYNISGEADMQTGNVNELMDEFSYNGTCPNDGYFF